MAKKAASPTFGVSGIVLSILVVVGTLLIPSLIHYVKVLGIGVSLNQLNNESCKLNNALDACETITIHHESGTAFLICEDPSQRNIWWPPANYRNTTGKATGKVSTYDLKTGNIKTLKFSSNFDMKDGIHAHGMSIFAHGKGLTVALINHRKTGSAVELFEYKLGADELVFKKTITDKLMPYPNSVTLQSKSNFYATNDHRWGEGLGRIVEEFARLPVTNVVFYDGEKSKMRVVAEGLRYANGIAISVDQSTVFVAETTGSYVAAFQRKENNNLRYVETLEMPMLVDNLFIEQKTGDLYAAGAVNVLQAKAHIKSGCKDNFVSGIIVKITKNEAKDQFYGKHYNIEQVWHGDGKMISLISTCAVDPHLNKSLIGSVNGKGFVVCDKAL